ncbi:hypothetical protein [Ostreiculturibacter nitratireducens]|uniref:hypothetical protein n=1 Tax=Ostreiculturibacter nitratireducens TaxID=3075226 RepID=UPI0031B5B25F
MADRKPDGQAFNIFCIAQSGRLQYEALILAASFRATNEGFAGRLIVGEPQPGPQWNGDPRISAPVRALLEGFGAEIAPIENRHFGQSYPHGNKIEGLFALPEGEPFLFLDSDTVITGPLASVGFDFARPSASMRREGTWPEPQLYGPGYAGIWKSLYDRFGLDFESSLDLSKPDEFWERYLYFNAGWFFYRCPRVFGERFRDYALSIRDDPPEELACQSLDPWLDQVALPLVIHSLGGGRPGPELSGLDGDVTCHYRTLPLLYARESDKVVALLEEIVAPNRLKKVLKEWEAARRLVYQRKGATLRGMFDRSDLPRREYIIRNKIKREGLWLR